VVNEGKLLDRRPRVLSAVVTALHDTGALLDLPHELAYDRVTGGEAAAPARNAEAT
jgi:hypothetical protein